MFLERAQDGPFQTERSDEAGGIYIGPTRNLVDDAATGGGVCIDPRNGNPIPTRSFGSPGRYEKMKYLAEGANGQVHLCKHTQTGVLVAIKTVNHYGIKEPHEVRMLQELGQHRNIVRFFEVIDHAHDRLSKRIVFEYCAMGDLADYIDTSQLIDIPEVFIWHAFKEIVEGLRYIHGVNMVHGDLKVANVLLCPPGRHETFPTLKIADFGAAVVKPSHSKPRGNKGTWAYCPPEATERFGPEADIWALGCIIHYLCQKCLPVVKIKLSKTSNFTIPNTEFHQNNPQFIRYLAEHQFSPIRCDKSSKQALRPRSKLLNYWMMRCLDINWQTRATVHQLHRFIPVIEPFVRKVLLLSRRYTAVLRSFDGVVRSDSHVLLQIFYAFADMVKKAKQQELIKLAAELPAAMDGVDGARARQYLQDVSLNLPSSPILDTDM